MMDDVVEEGSAPDVVGEVYGVRSWLVSPSEGHLGEWKPGVNKARCRAHGFHESPDPLCGCGLYAYYGLGRFESRGTYGNVIGLVKGWGKVAVARDGWRAQYAEVVALCDDPQNTDLQELAAIYNVPIMDGASIDYLARNNTVPVDIRPGYVAVEKPLPVKPVALGGPAPLMPLTGAVSGSGEEVQDILEAFTIVGALALLMALILLAGEGVLSDGLAVLIGVGVGAALTAIWWRFIA